MARGSQHENESDRGNVLGRSEGHRSTAEGSEEQLGDKKRVEELEGPREELNDLKKRVEKPEKKPDRGILELREYDFWAVLWGSFLITILFAGAMWGFPHLIKEYSHLASALGLAFGALVGLIGSYLGVKASRDARKEAHHLAHRALDKLSGSNGGETGGNHGQPSEGGKDDGDEPPGERVQG